MASEGDSYDVTQDASVGTAPNHVPGERRGRGRGGKRGGRRGRRGGGPVFHDRFGSNTRGGDRWERNRPYGGSPTQGRRFQGDRDGKSTSIGDKDRLEENWLVVYAEEGCNIDSFSLVEYLREVCGTERIQSRIRDREDFGFVGFPDGECVQRVLEAEGGDHLVADISYSFARCNRVTPGRDPRLQDPDSQRKNETLVIKNLPFSLKLPYFQQTLDKYDPKPEEVYFHYDGTGQFRGIAFARYATVDDAASVFGDLSNLFFSNRKARVEYCKRSVSEENAQHRRGFDDEGLSRLESQLATFCDDPELKELAFPSTYTSVQRKQVHRFAHRMGLYHYSQGQGSDRHIVVTKTPPPPDVHSSEWDRDGGRGRGGRGEYQRGGRPGGGLYDSQAQGGGAKSGYVKSSNKGIQPIRQPRIPENPLEDKGFNLRYRLTREGGKSAEEIDVLVQEEEEREAQLRAKEEEEEREARDRRQKERKDRQRNKQRSRRDTVDDESTAGQGELDTSEENAGGNAIAEEETRTCGTSEDANGAHEPGAASASDSASET